MKTNILIAILLVVGAVFVYRYVDKLNFSSESKEEVKSGKVEEKKVEQNNQLRETSKSKQVFY